MTSPLSRYREVNMVLNENATMTLFRQDKWAPIILATLMTVYEQGQREVPVDQCHAQVRRVFLAIQEDMTDFPIDPDDPRAVRERCRTWIGSGWLIRDGGETEVYRLSPEAREAMRITREMTSTRAAMSESQVRVILDRAQALALKATADPEARKERLRAELERLQAEQRAVTAELERLESGGAVEMAADEEILNDFLLLSTEIERLPTDLKRVEESFAALANGIVQDFLADLRPHGAIVKEYLDRVENLVTADRYGRGFQQAKMLLGDDVRREDLRRNIEVILSHPFVDVLTERERDDIRRVVRSISAAVGAVYAQRRQMTDRVSNYLRGHDAARERELHRALVRAQAGLRSWVAANPSPRARLTTPVGFVDSPDGPVGEVGLAEVNGIREYPLTPVTRTPLRPLAESGGTGAVQMSAEQLREMGGPFYAELADAVEAALTRRDRVGGHEVFNALPDRLRRPVDLLGLLNIAVETGTVALSEDATQFHAVRPDGSMQTFYAPPMIFTRAPVGELTERKPA